MFEWKCHPEAEKWLYSLLRTYKEKNPAILHLETELMEKTSTRLFDWIDHFTLDFSAAVERELEGLGFEQELASADYRVFTHFGAKLPSLLVRDAPSKHPLGIAIKVESIADFMMIRGLNGTIEGSQFSPYRRGVISTANGTTLLAIERRGVRTVEPTYPPERYLEDYLECVERWQTRPRRLDHEKEDMDMALQVAQEMVGLVGKDIAAHIVLECERKYWQASNTAAALQKNRQDRLGMGWANHDHHTFRSSRPLFQELVRLFEILGFTCRERYYAGEQAGWGAQIMENAHAGLVLFLDVDLGPDELDLDFAHHPLSYRDKLTTVGLWCALHGDSILKSGMHHLEAQFIFDRLKQDIENQGVGMMDPFSDFPYLRQAFTKGEMWPVSPKRIERLLQRGQITREQADHFLSKGALGSHLENLERHEGYKGFNKDSVNRIIQKTDPRLA